MSRTTRAVVAFVALAYGLAWLVALPLWLGDGLAHPLFGLIAMAMMFTPTVAALIVVLFVDRPRSIPRALGLWPLKPAGRFIAYLALGLFVPIVLCLIALPIGAALGVYQPDLANFSAFREALAASGQDELPLPIETLVALQFVNIFIGAFINLIPSLGEEIGWRGWLLPKLMPWGPVQAILISGVIWGLWHAPLILLGYNYPGAPGWLGLLLMTGMCILIGAVFGWVRLRSDSVWPAALAHGAFNAAAGSFILFADAREQVDTVHATVLGWSGWLIPVILVIALVATGQFRARPPAAPTLASPHPDPIADSAPPDHPAGPTQSQDSVPRAGGPPEGH